MMQTGTFVVHNGQIIIRKQDEPTRDEAENIDDLITLSFTSQGKKMRGGKEQSDGGQSDEEQSDEEEALPLGKQAQPQVTRWVTVGGKRVPIGPKTGSRKPKEGAETQPGPIGVRLVAPADFDRSISSSKYGVTLTDYSTSDYEEMKCYLAPGLNAGFAITQDGEGVSLHNNSDQRGIGEQLVALAKQVGMTHFDHFDIPRLNEIYDAAGFVETERLEFDPQYAPEGWDYDKYGSPSVVFRQLAQQAA